MVLSLGPVLRYELITTARRRRYYIVKTVYALILLAQLWYLFTQWQGNHQSGGSRDELQVFAEDAFIQFAGAQGLGLLILIPALFAGVISDEYQRKTLHYLLASRLSSAEIILGKLGARLVHVLAFIAVGLPIVSLLMLYGGLNPTNIFYVYLGTATLVLFTSGFSVLISILAKRPRDAILATYGLGAIWLVVPIYLETYSRFLDGPLAWVPPVNDALLFSNPWNLWQISTQRNYAWYARMSMPGWMLSWNWFPWRFAIMTIIQASFGLIFLLLAIALLRPLRGSSWPGAKPQTGWWTRLSERYRRFVESRAAAAVTRNELLATRAVRPSVGEDPMLWKERYSRMGGGLRWLGSRPVALFFSVLLGCYLFDVAYPVVGSLLRLTWHERDWYVMSSAVRTSSSALAVLAMLPIMAAAATSLTSEREQDTWTSLATTLLTPREVVRAKEMGAIWSARWIGIALLVLWGSGLVFCTIHPVGLLAAMGILASSAWLISAFGVFASSVAVNSTRALFITFGVIFAFTALSGWPVSLWSSLASYRDMSFLWTGQHPASVARSTIVAPPLLGAFVTTAFQSMLAVLFGGWATSRLKATWGKA